MGRQGHAPRRFSRIHPKFGTPFWSVTTATFTIVALIVAFIAVFPAEGGITSINLGLTALTGFATFNLLLSLAVVNAALIYHRLAFPDIKRGFRVPGVPLVPVGGILANLGLIYNLPNVGVVTGVILTVALLVAYLVWGGAPEIEELVRRVGTPESEEEEAEGATETTAIAETEGTTGGGEGEDYYRVLVPIARPERAVRYVRLAERLAVGHDKEPLVQVLTVTLQVLTVTLQVLTVTQIDGHTDTRPDTP